MKFKVTQLTSLNHELNKQYEVAYKLGVAKRLASLNTTKVTDLNGQVYREIIKFPDCGTVEAPIVPSWLEKAPLEEVKARFELQAKAREAYTEELVKLGFTEKILEGKVKIYGVEKDGEFYTYSAVSRKSDDGTTTLSGNYPLISKWIEENIDDADAPVCKALNNYLETFWMDEENYFKQLGGKENTTITLYPGMTLDECRSLQRFYATIKSVNTLRENNQSDWEFLKEFLSGAGGVSIKELRHLGIIQESEDCSRSKEAEEKLQYFNSLSEKDRILWYFTRKVVKFLSRYEYNISEILETKDYRNFSSFENLVWQLKVYEGVQRRDENGSLLYKEVNGEKVPALLNSWNYWDLTLPYYIKGAFSAGDLAMAFFKFSERAAMFGHTPQDQAEFQFTSWAKAKKEYLKDYVFGTKDNPEGHPKSKDFYLAFCAKLEEDEIYDDGDDEDFDD